MNDILEATGLQKGGLYNHFGSKEELAVEAFDYAFGVMSQKVADALEGKTDAIERLLAIIGVFRNYDRKPLIPGGCPLLNTAIESDDSNPALREHARQAMDRWRGLIHRTIEKGVKQGTIRHGVDLDFVSTLIISGLEGSLMMSKLCNDPSHLRRMIVYLEAYVERELRAEALASRA